MLTKMDFLMRNEDQNDNFWGNDNQNDNKNDNFWGKDDQNENKDDNKNDNVNDKKLFCCFSVFGSTSIS